MMLKTFLTIIIICILTAIILFDSTKTKEHITEESGLIKHYFCPDTDCDEIIITLAKDAISMHCAFYEIKNEDLIKTLQIKNHKYLVFSDNYKGFGQKIESTGLMHNKFCIINGTHILTGSHNPTSNKNQDNMLLIESNQLVANYEEEFNELISSRTESTKVQKFIHNGYMTQNYFCPEDDCQKKIITLLKEAEQTVKFMLFTFTDKEIADELIILKSKGILVEGIIDPLQNKYSVKNKLLLAGILIYEYKGEGLQHNKVFIIDNKTLITGSYNPTKAANTVNDENILVINEPSIVQAYTERFSNLLRSAVALTNTS